MELGFRVREKGGGERGGGCGDVSEADEFFLIKSLLSFEIFPNTSSAALHTDCVSDSLSLISIICTSLEILGNISLISDVFIDTLLSLQSPLMSISAIELHFDENSNEIEKSVGTRSFGVA